MNSSPIQRSVSATTNSARTGRRALISLRRLAGKAGVSNMPTSATFSVLGAALGGAAPFFGRCLVAEVADALAPALPCVGKTSRRLSNSASKRRIMEQYARLHYRRQLCVLPVTAVVGVRTNPARRVVAPG